MTYAFTPNGFGDERKRKAAECEELWETATDVVTFLAVGCAALNAPVAVPLVVVAALGRVLKHPFTRVKNDPPRRDYYESVTVPPLALDPTLLFVVPRVGRHARLMFIALSVAADRTATYLDATVSSVERAMGAFEDGADAAADLRVAEARFHAANAELSSAGLASVAPDVERIEVARFWDAAQSYVNENPNDTIGQMLSPAAYDAYVRTGLDQQVLDRPLVLYRRPLRQARTAGKRLRDLAAASRATSDFAQDLARNSPTNVVEWRASS